MAVLALTAAATLGLAGCATRAEPLATMAHPRGEIRLLAAPCSAGPGQRAVQREAVHERQGCWQATPGGNVFVLWADGARQVLDGNRVKLAPRLAELLEEPEAAPPAPAVPAPRKPARPRKPPAP